MNAHGIGQDVNRGLAIGHSRRADLSLQKAEKDEAVDQNQIRGDLSNDPEESESSEGVLRLLQEGHFKGVADVRLRINFYDQLAAAETEARRQAATEKANDISDSISAQSDAILNSGDLTDEQATAVTETFTSFNTALSDLAAEIAGAEEVSGDNLATAIQSKFDALMESLQGTLIAEEQTGSEQVAIDEETGDPAPDFQPFLDTLAETFSTALADLTEALNSTQVLPELSEPEGKGKAYAKFVAIYNEMRGVEQNANVSTDQSINTMA